MLPTTLSLLGAVILILDIFAIVSVLLGKTSVMRKLLWIAIVLLLPVIGMVLYFLIGRSAFDAQV
ncbi:MAG: PLDc N-terminal domain-containing protein [Rhodopirellula sp.]|nr:PLDc N-terminal domain-containing protein [Rhodopirellula sp.]